MRYFKNVNDDYITVIGTEIGGEEITEAEYDLLLDTIRNKPAAPEGYTYRLKNDMTWELFELPPEPAPSPAEELSADEALEIITGGTI